MGDVESPEETPFDLANLVVVIFWLIFLLL